MAIFPRNVEQLEIGRCIEALHLGVLVKQPYEELRGEQLGALIDKLRTDARIELELEKHSALLRAEDGPRRAVSIVLDSLAGRVGAASAPRLRSLRAGAPLIDVDDGRHPGWHAGQLGLGLDAPAGARIPIDLVVEAIHDGVSELGALRGGQGEGS